jgi:S1-C subfamily serine protease
MASKSTLIVLGVSAALVLIGVLGKLGDTGKARGPEMRPERKAADSFRPRMPSLPERRADGMRALPAPTGTDPAVEVAIGPRQQNSVGTAWSLDGRGTWMTARHVADGCTRMFVLTGPREGLQVQSVYIHPSADLAVIRTSRGGPALALTREAPKESQTGYHFGFPKGEPGDVRSKLLGRMTMRVRGRYHTAEPVLVWAEIARQPDGEEHLGGISGGPSFDSAGRVNGVTVAGSQRRGRVFTADMSSLQAALQRANARMAPESEATLPNIVPQGFPVAGTALRRQFSIAKVACLVERRDDFGSGPRGPGGNRGL